MMQFVVTLAAGCNDCDYCGEPKIVVVEYESLEVFLADLEQAVPAAIEDYYRADKAFKGWHEAGCPSDQGPLPVVGGHLIVGRYLFYVHEFCTTDRKGQLSFVVPRVQLLADWFAEREKLTPRYRGCRDPAFF